MDDSRLTKRVFLWDYNQTHGWCSDMKNIFSSIGLNNLNETISIQIFIIFAENKLKTDQFDKWNSDIINQPKLRTYVQIKDEYKC